MGRRSGAWMALLAVCAGCQFGSRSNPVRLLRNEPAARAASSASPSTRADGTIASAGGGETAGQLAPIAIPDVPNPRLVSYARDAGTVQLSLRAAIQTAIDNSEVARTIADQNTVAAATAYDPAIVDSQVQAEEGLFNPQLEVGSVWDRIDRPRRKTAEGAFVERNQLDRTDFRASLDQPLYTGGTVGIGYDTNYTFFPADQNPNGFLNPQYFTPLTFRFNQPLLQGHGYRVNTAPIVIAARRSDRSTWEFKEAMLAMVRSVEETYWQVYAAQVEVAAIAEVVPMFEEVVRVNRERVRFETGAEVDADQAETQLWQFQRLLLQAKLRRADSINLLRNVIGLPPTDQRDVALETRPYRDRIGIDWEETLAIAMDERPDVMRRRLSVRVRQLERVLATNARRVRLDAFGQWGMNGLSDELGKALTILGDNQFADWQLGFQFSVPLGRDTARAGLRAANLALQREVVLLDQTSHAAAHELAEIIRSLDSLYDQYRVARDQTAAAERWREGARQRYLHPAGGTSQLAALNNYLGALRRWALAKGLTADLLGRYNTDLARLEEAKGTLLENRYVRLHFDSCRAAAQILDHDSDGAPHGSAPATEPLPEELVPPRPAAS